MTKADLIRLVKRLPDETIEPLSKFLEAVLQLKPELTDPDNDWRLLQGMYEDEESLTIWLEKEHARELEQEERKAGR